MQLGCGDALISGNEGLIPLSIIICTHLCLFLNMLLGLLCFSFLYYHSFLIVWNEIYYTLGNVTEISI